MPVRKILAAIQITTNTDTASKTTVANTSTIQTSEQAQSRNIITIGVSGGRKINFLPEQRPVGLAVRRKYRRMILINPKSLFRQI